MNKTEMIEKLASKTGLTRKDAASAIDAVFGTDRTGILASELMKGKKITITGFGSFEVRKRKGRMGRNPQTGDEIKIAASKFPSFRAGKALKDAVRR